VEASASTLACNDDKFWSNTGIKIKEASQSSGSDEEKRTRKREPSL
jgi:hypothetical protein